MKAYTAMKIKKGVVTATVTTKDKVLADKLARKYDVVTVKHYG